MDFVDVKYINLVSPRLQKFKKINNNLYNCRCILCGDSKKNKNKARGYFYQVKNNTNYKCHNCGVNISFNNYLKIIDIDLHKQYIFEKFKDGNTSKYSPVDRPKFFNFTPEFKTKVVLDIPKASENLKAKKYLKDRNLNPDIYYYADKFKEWVNSIKPTFEDIKIDESRIIIPLIYKNIFIGFQGRSIGPSSVKYITIMLDEDAPKIYGLDEIDINKTVYITEGPFDSYFIDNSVALCGADGDLSTLGIKDYVWIYDNEPRNLEIAKRISNVIDSDQKIVIWPNSIKEKDINEMINNGKTKEELMNLVKINTYSGLEAKLKFTSWKKI